MAADRRPRCARCRDAGRGQAGETLVEGLLAILIISIVALSAYAALQTAIRVSVMHREQAVAETLLRSAAERLQDPTEPYVPRAGCAAAGSYVDLPTSPGYSPVSASVRFWVPPASVASDVTTQFSALGVCPASDPGLQLIELQVTTPAGYVERLEIVKRAT